MLCPQHKPPIPGVMPLVVDEELSGSRHADRQFMVTACCSCVRTNRIGTGPRVSNSNSCGGSAAGCGGVGHKSYYSRVLGGEKEEEEHLTNGHKDGPQEGSVLW